MVYKRQWRPHSSFGPCKVSLAWDAFIGAYNLQFTNIGSHWDKVQGIITWIKMTIPGGEREYDDVSKVWTLDKKHYKMLRQVLEAVGNDFELNVAEEPVGGSSTKFVPTDTYIKLFEKFTGVDLSSYGDERFNEAKRIYFKTCMKLHPDRHPDNPDAAKDMSDFNEAWDVIKLKHFKIVRSMEQIQ